MLSKRFEPRKGIKIFTDSLLPILDKYPKIKIVIIGKHYDNAFDEYFNDIKKSLGKHSTRFLFIQFIEKPLLYRIIKNSRLVVLSSTWEAFGYTCLESLALSKIVIASGGSGFEEQIQNDGMNGFLFKTEDSGMLTRKINNALKLSGNKLRRIQNNAEKRAYDFDNNVIVPKVLQFYKKIADN